MGYYSEFKIDLVDESFADAFMLALKELDNDGYVNYLDVGYDSTFSTYDTKWYDFDHDMEAVAKALPQMDFGTERLGEDGEGQRRTYRGGSLVGKQMRGWVEA